MIVPSAIRRRFEDWSPELEALASDVRQTVSQYCDREGFAYIGRIKTLESLAEKIETGRYGMWSDLDDLFACAVIVPTLNYENRVLEFLRTAFLEIGVKRRGSTRKSPDVFRFEATRFNGRLRPIRSSDAASLRHQTTFEVQVRSAFEHAWSVATHAIYKGGSVNWKTRRLVAQLKAAVEQLDSLVLTFDASSDPIVEHQWPDLEIQRQIVGRFSEAVSAGKIPQEMAPKDWSRFAENLFNLIRKSDRPRGDNLEKRIIASLALIEGELPSDPLSLPHSLSLLQYAFAIVARGGILKPPFRDYIPLITDDLRSFYRDISSFDPGFSFEE